MQCYIIISFVISGDKPFSCEICQKKFALACNLRAHLKTHEAEYASSAASMALYQRAIAALGDLDAAAANAGRSPTSSPVSPPTTSLLSHITHHPGSPLRSSSSSPSSSLLMPPPQVEEEEEDEGVEEEAMEDVEEDEIEHKISGDEEERNKITDPNSDDSPVQTKRASSRLRGLDYSKHLTVTV